MASLLGVGLLLFRGLFYVPVCVFLTSSYLAQCGSAALRACSCTGYAGQFFDFFGSKYCE